MQLSEKKGAKTQFKTATKKGKFEYVVTVTQAGDDPPLVMEDPDLEVNYGGGGGGTEKVGSGAAKFKKRAAATKT